jgi:hypothetical protein
MKITTTQDYLLVIAIGYKEHFAKPFHINKPDYLLTKEDLLELACSKKNLDRASVDEIVVIENDEVQQVEFYSLNHTYGCAGWSK